MADDVLVTIELEQARQYRNRETMRVSEIGPGKVQVPRSVAERWGFHDAEEAPQQEPIGGYAQLNATQVVELLPKLTRDERDAVKAYEQMKARRKSVLRALEEDV